MNKYQYTERRGDFQSSITQRLKAVADFLAKRRTENLPITHDGKYPDALLHRNQVCAAIAEIERLNVQSTLYRADVEYQTEEQTKKGVGRGISIEFHHSSVDRVEILRAVKKWWDNRHQAISDHFYRLACIKVYRLVPTTFQDDGYLPQNTNFPLIEWKCDRPDHRHLLKAV